MKINARLKTIGDLVEANSFCLDVGCDHALLDIYLIQRNKDIQTVASDIAKGPLEQARKNIEREHLEGRIELRQGPGLKTYSPDINTVIISGMGGRTIIGICRDDMKIMKKVDTFIISPNNYQEDVKRFFCKNGFYLENEEFVKDKNIIYQILIFKRGKRRYTKIEYFFGPVFLVKKGPLFHEYFEKELKSREILLSLLPHSYPFRRRKLMNEIKMIKKEIED